MSFAANVRAVWPDQADEVLGLIHGTIDPDTYSSVAEWIRACYHPPNRHERIARALDQVLGTHGVEACFSRDSWTQPKIEYLNAGDTYATTLVYLPGSGRWRVSTWGDQVEAFERRRIYFD